MKNKYLIYGLIAILLIGAITMVEATKKVNCSKFDVNKDGLVDSADVSELESQGKNVNPIMRVLRLGLCSQTE